MNRKEALDALAEIWREHQIPMSDYNGRVFDAIEAALLRDDERTRLRAQCERLAYALRIIAGETQCIDNLMGNVDVARAALAEYREGEA